jgi:hypothetical protein
LTAEKKREYVNDSKLVLYHLYYNKDKRLAKNYFRQYQKGLSEGIFTLFKPLENFVIKE